MGAPYQFIGSGYYTSDTTAQNIALSDRPDYFSVEDRTLWGAANTAVAAMKSWWRRDMASGSYLQIGQISAAAASNYMYGAQGTSGGFTFIDQTNPPVFAKVAVTGVNGTTGVVLTGTTTGLAVGDWVRLINIVGAQELSGPIAYQITAVSAGVSFTLGYFATAASAGFSVSNGTTGYYQKVYPGFMYPSKQYVIGITQAVQAKVYFPRKNDFTVGELVDFQIPSSYGMTQLNNLTAAPPYPQNGSGNKPGAARVLVVTNSATESSIVIDYNTTGFTAFAQPVSASFASGHSPATCFPAGSGVVPYNGSATIPQSPPGTNLVDSFDNRAQYVMNLGTSVVGANNSVMYWEAYRGDYFNGITNA